MNKIIVTGGAGFICSHLCDFLCEYGYSIGVIDNFSYGKHEFVPRNENVKTFEADIRDGNAIRNIFETFQPEIIYHLAALHHIPTCEQKPSEALQINIIGTQNILDIAAKLPNLQKIVFASSGAVYEIVDSFLLEDSTPVQPYDVYSTSKLCGEHLLRLWSDKFGKKVHIGRIFNTIGGRETNDHLVPDIITQLLKGAKEIKLGNLEPKRSYIDVRDTAMGLLKIGEYNSDKKFDVFNIGREDEYNVKDIVEKLIVVAQIKSHIVQDPSRIRKVDRKKQQASMNKMKDKVQWQPKFSVEDGLKYAYSFAQKQQQHKSDIIYK